LEWHITLLQTLAVNVDFHEELIVANFTSVPFTLYVPLICVVVAALSAVVLPAATVLEWHLSHVIEEKLKCFACGWDETVWQEAVQLRAPAPDVQAIAEPNTPLPFEWQ
jgi:hypothetical protein